MSNTLYRLTVVDITDMGISLLWMDGTDYQYFHDGAHGWRHLTGP